LPHYTITVAPEKSDMRVTRIVEAKNQARAIAHVVGDSLIVSLAEPADFMALAKAGGEIETAKED
jgi:hypothetical protein